MRFLKMPLSVSVACLRFFQMALSVSATCLRYKIIPMSVSVACLRSKKYSCRSMRLWRILYVSALSKTLNSSISRYKTYGRWKYTALAEHTKTESKRSLWRSWMRIYTIIAKSTLRNYRIWSPFQKCMLTLGVRWTSRYFFSPRMWHHAGRPTMDHCTGTIETNN